jgi:uncharacterized protein (TIGR03437 family)
MLATITFTPAGPPITPRTVIGSVDQRFHLPMELSGVTMAINGATVGLKSVSDGQITFVTPPGLLITSQGVRYPYVVNNQGEVFRGEISFVSSRPDIFTRPPTPPGPNGRADARNVVNPVHTFEPFDVTTVPSGGGDAVPTVLRLRATGILDRTAAQLVVRIGPFTITGIEILSGATQVEPGVYEFDFRLAPQMAGAGDQPIVLQASVGIENFFSRLDDTAPMVLISGTPPAPTPTPTPAGATNFALASNGGTASASSEYDSSYPAAAINNGDRRGLNWGAGGGWGDNSPGLHPDWVQINFNGSKSINEIDVFTIQDNYASPVEPSLSDTFTQYGVTALDIQYWNGSGWVTVPGGSISANNKVWTQASFGAITTDRIRVRVDDSLAGYSRIAEVEAWGSGGTPSPTPTPTPTPTPSPTPDLRTNFALTLNGGTASASSEFSPAYPASSIVNGDRKGLNWGSGGGWGDNSPDVYPDSVQVNFNGSKLINEIDVFTVQDNYSSPSEPALSDTFTQYGVTAFDIQYWNGSGWVTAPGGSITTNKVWTKVSFSPVDTSAIRVVVYGSLAGFSRIVEVEAWGEPSAPPASTNYALASNGGLASASSEFSSSYPAAAINNGDRKGLNWASGGGWGDNSPDVYPDWIQVNFNGTKSINQIGVFTIQDNYTSPSTPDLNMTFSQFGVTHFEVLYWNGAAWVPVPGGNVSGNNKVWTQLTFAPITTDKVRVQVNNSLSSFSRVVEIEAFGSP